MRGKTRTKKEIKNIVSGLGYKTVKIYFQDNYIRRVIVKDSHGFMHDSALHVLIKRKVLTNFVDSRNKFSIRNIALWLKINKKKFKIDTEQVYINARLPLKFKCLKCGNYFHKSWDVVSSGYRCQFCYGKGAREFRNLKYSYPKVMLDWSNKNIIDPEKTTAKSSKIAIWKCHICKNEWKTTINNRTSKGSGCPYCSGLRASSTRNFMTEYPELMLEWDYSKNDSPTIFTPKSPRKAWWICKKCGHNWSAIISSRANGRGCPKCRESRGEKEISAWLEKNSIHYIRQYRFKDCRYKNPLPFDFYLPEHNICIEYQGKQHYAALENGFFGGKRGFNKIRKTDSIKLEYCRSNKISLIEIPYTSFFEISSILGENIS